MSAPSFGEEPNGSRPTFPQCGWFCKSPRRMIHRQDHQAGRNEGDDSESLLHP
jgi:hypothetical protein